MVYHGWACGLFYSASTTTEQVILGNLSLIFPRKFYIMFDFLNINKCTTLTYNDLINLLSLAQFKTYIYLIALYAIKYTYQLEMFRYQYCMRPIPISISTFNMQSRYRYILCWLIFFSISTIREYYIKLLVDIDYV